jgi:hypothetical protein
MNHAIEWNQARAEKMRANGETWTAIGREFGVDPKTAKTRLDPAYREKRRIRCRSANPGVMRSYVKSEPIENVPPVPPDTRGLTARAFGDPIFERSALYAKLYGGAAL